MEHLEQQYKNAEEIERCFRNFKRDGPDRKDNVAYFKKRMDVLEALWRDFQFLHDQICMDISKTNPYFLNNIYENTKQNYEQYKLKLNEGYQHLVSQKGVAGVGTQSGQDNEKQEQSTSAKKHYSGEYGQQEGTEETTQNEGLVEGASGYKPTPTEPTLPRQQSGTFSKLDEMLRKQEANFRAFARTMANINEDNLTEKWEFEDSLKLLENRWLTIDRLHLEIDSELNGSNKAYESMFSHCEHQYFTIKKNINKQMWSVSHREQSTPKLDIPVFSGSYNNWTSFKDLFTEAIHNNPTLSNAQRMQFLKSKLKGEAERLIQHLSISSDNYLTSWEILKHRYDNKKFIFTSHMNILFSLPNIQQNTAMNQIKKMHDIALETLNARTILNILYLSTLS